MKPKLTVVIALLAVCFAARIKAGPLQRIGHTTLPLHSPADKGMYAGVIDPVNGYAYFVGSYLYKLDITGHLPVQVGPELATGQFTQGSLDSAAGYLYLVKNSVNRYNLGTGTNPVTFSSSLSLVAGSGAEMVIDDSDTNPANHYGYVVCSVSGAPSRVAKIALGTFTEVNSISLAAGESNFFFGAAVDAQKGYAYFANSLAGSSNLPLVVKIKMTPGTNLPIRIGAVNLDTVSESIDGGCIDTVHGYAYYDTYDSNTNNPGIVYKMKLGDGDVAPTVAGKTLLKAGEGRLSAGVVDPIGGYVYFANDNTYPGDICQLSLNGTNAPVEITYYALQGGTNNSPPPNGVTTNNNSADGTNLAFGEVFIRSAVIDLVRGNAYFGQDSRPNQVIKMQLAKVDPFTVSKPQILTNGALQFGFTNIPGATFNTSSTSNVTQPFTNWTIVGSVVETSSGQYQFTDPQPVNAGPRFYRVHSP